MRVVGSSVGVGYVCKIMFLYIGFLLIFLGFLIRRRRFMEKKRVPFWVGGGILIIRLGYDTVDGKY